MANDPQVAAASIWLNAWERAAAFAPPQRAVELLRAGVPGCDDAALAVGARDAMLLDLRAALFGAQLACTAACPGCGERCEWSCALDELRGSAHPADAAEVHELAADGWRLRYRVVTAGDLAQISAGADEPGAVQVLLERCVLEARYEGMSRQRGELPESVLEKLSAALAAADPQAATSVALHCPACNHHWEAGFDIASFLWSELDVWAQRTLHDVHELALRYSWSEPEILAMSPARRAHYLSLGAP